MWKNVIKVMRSKLFKDTLKNGDYTIKESEKANRATALDDYASPSSERKIQIGLAGSSLTSCKYLAAYETDESDNNTGKIKDIYTKNVSVGHADVTSSIKLSSDSQVTRVTSAGLYAVTINYSGSYSTHMLSIIDLNMGTQSVPDSNGHYASYSPSLKTIITSLEAVATVYKVVCIAQYDF